MKTVLKIGGVFLLLLFVGVVVLSVALNSIIKKGVESIGPAITGTEVTIEDVDFSLFSGKGRLGKLVIGNPQGFRTHQAFKLSEVQVEADLISVWSDTIRIQEILIDSPEISFEATPSGSNLGKIQKNVRNFSGLGTPKDQSVVRDDQPEGRSHGQTSNETRIQIDEFILKNARVTVSTPFIQEDLFTIYLPVVQLQDIGKKTGGATLKEISSLILSETQRAIEEEISKSGKLGGLDLKKLEKDLGRIVEKASKVLEGLKGIF